MLSGGGAVGGRNGAKLVSELKRVTRSQSASRLGYKSKCDCWNAALLDMVGGQAGNKVQMAGKSTRGKGIYGPGASKHLIGIYIHTPIYACIPFEKGAIYAHSYLWKATVRTSAGVFHR